MFLQYTIIITGVNNLRRQHVKCTDVVLNDFSRRKKTNCSIGLRLNFSRTTTPTKATTALIIVIIITTSYRREGISARFFFFSSGGDHDKLSTADAGVVSCRTTVYKNRFKKNLLSYSRGPSLCPP